MKKSVEFLNGGVSHWMREAGVPAQRRPLPDRWEGEVAIAGGGMTGLWTAYYLKQARPDWRIAVVEKEFCGFGASGRNGGWLSGEPAGFFRRYSATHGVDAAVRQQRAMFATIDEVLAVAERHGIDADIVKNGLIHVATSAAQQARLTHHAKELAHQGWDAEDLELLSGDEVRARVAVDGALGGLYTPHCARVHPAKLVRGLADVVSGLGIEIFEGTAVTRIEPRRMETEFGIARAETVISALEGYTDSVRGRERLLLPMNSSMIVTERLPQSVWDEIGWSRCELVGDEAHSFAYCQRTADDRIAIGGRGVPYNYASGYSRIGRTAEKAIGQLMERLVALFPATRDAEVHHSWSGILGVPRDWCASVHLDPRTRIGSAGGYVGHGVAATNLAGRTMRDLVLGESTDLTSLPWVNHEARRWEPEPLRWIGASALYAAYRAADRHETSSARPRTSPLGTLATRVSGRH